MDSGQIVHIDPDRRMIGLHIYDGLFKVCGGKGYITHLGTLHVMLLVATRMRQFLHSTKSAEDLEEER